MTRLMRQRYVRPNATRSVIVTHTLPDEREVLVTCTVSSSLEEWGREITVEVERVQTDDGEWTDLPIDIVNEKDVRDAAIEEASQEDDAPDEED